LSSKYLPVFGWHELFNIPRVPLKKLWVTLNTCGIFPPHLFHDLLDNEPPATCFYGSGRRTTPWAILRHSFQAYHAAAHCKAAFAA